MDGVRRGSLSTATKAEGKQYKAVCHGGRGRPQPPCARPTPDGQAGAGGCGRETETPACFRRVTFFKKAASGRRLALPASPKRIEEGEEKVFRFKSMPSSKMYDRSRLSSSWCHASKRALFQNNSRSARKSSRVGKGEEKVLCLTHCCPPHFLPPSLPTHSPSLGLVFS